MSQALQAFAGLALANVLLFLVSYLTWWWKDK